MSEGPRRPFLGLSWFQVIASALAAMTSAWIASTLGVAGTIIGAALGSLVATVTSALYANTLDRSRTLIVRTDSGTVVETRAEPGETSAALEQVREATDSPIRGAQVIDEPRRVIRWKAIIVTSVTVLLIALAAMGGYELVTGKSYGADPDNARIGNPFGGGSTPSDDADDPADEPEDPATTPTPEPTDTTTVPTPPETSPVPSPSPTATTTSPTPEATE